ncbi:MAG: response regulator [Candidatus Marinimicrobia bacterium]|nr:response regulator [Candidatus Neomarinimicrobiota bacterium]
MRILIVDDIKMNLELLEALLEKSGYEVVSAMNGKEALEKLHSERFDMIISDILMPVMDGFQLCRECKSSANLKIIPFIFYTATYTDKKDEEFALSMGAEKYITKPLEQDELLKIIESVIKDHREGALVAPKPKSLVGREKEHFKIYSERLVNKLEKKMLDIEKEIDKRKQKEEHIKHLNNVLKAIRSVNHLIVTEKDRDRLLQKACDALIEAREYDAAWIGFLGNDKTFSIVKGSGLKTEVSCFIKQMTSGNHPNCIKKALAREEKSLIMDKSRECGKCFFEDACIGKEVAVIHVKHAGRLLGLLTILLKSGISVDDEERILLQEAADDIALALHDMEMEKERNQTEEEARKMHQGLVEAHEKLQRVYESEKQLRDKLIQSEKLASLGQMGAKIAHEINNPLTVISGRAQLYLMEDLDEQLKKTFNTIVRESNRIKCITSAYRNLSRPALPKKELLGLNEVLEESVENLITTGEVKHYKIQKNFYPDLPEVIGDRDRLIQVFRNLIVNASHAMADSKEKILTLRSSVSKDGKFAEISIQDSGSGIEKEKLDKIFEVYYTTKADGLGTGLGLVVVKDIIEKQHKGRVLVESEVGKGTTFTIQLPLKTKRKQKKILIVEDEAYVREFYMTFFEDKGLEVFTAVNGKEALDNYEKIQPDIILSDIDMPVMNGFELVKEIKLKKYDQSIVLMTGLYYETSVKEQLKKANIPFFTKPANLNDVWKIVSEELKKSS